MQPETLAAIAHFLRLDPSVTEEDRALMLRFLQYPHEAADEREPYLNLKELGKILNIHPTTLWKWQVPGHRLGGCSRYRLSEVRRYLESTNFETRAGELKIMRMEKRSPRQPTPPTT